MPETSGPRSPDSRSGSDLQTGGGTGLSSNVAGALSYLVGVLTGVLFLLLDKERPFVRFHASQSIVFSLAWVGVWIAMAIIDLVLGAIPLLGWLISFLLNVGLALLGFGLWLLLMWRAYQGDEWELPVVGEYARKLAREAV